MLKHSRTVAFGALIVGLFVLTTVALATAPTGQQVSPPLVGTLHKIHRIHTDGIKLRTRSPVEVSTFTITLAPGGFTGWHRHPGILFATVQVGAVVRQVGCRSRTYRVGQTFVEHGRQPTGQVTNPSATDPAAFSVTQIAPPGVVKREETEPPDC